jgi:uncharacterized protein YdeI (YjbR/CyaY-like superfamily)
MRHDRPMPKPSSRPRSFATPAAFRAWLEAHHASETELVMRLFKVHAKHRGIGYREALDAALCFGWIDGVVRRLDEDSFLQRFTPRRPGSRWSQVNVKRYGELKAAGRVHAAGQAAFDAWDRAKAPYSFDAAPQVLDPVFLEALRAHPKAWAFFQALPPGYRRIITFYVMSAKREPTRASRFAKLFGYLKKGRRMPLMGE